ncbi:uncharacterized protein LOC123545749 [Mercenaria mercenaria]|uniref:uncharacterized protein LOC123545749 n=1 Tax=Mercenaria mercenaria TaxID=6596 RepID=UPI001E1DE3DE|nr:uncharacterized protein LOC123545749 [Mercenaria mercenaria]XP_045188000.1 uncharacterized protein LOC123545749 [Mercenaria mercenaria]XP_045188008.1 uncharacterized protein LOC123545749 [Mercenaria mercenaria]XP_045188013.1 uncharacterized protein LOC123545749 [Mercenaria mercenaria]XP_045188020.1 uncharacterized protein LOC123545749 [Mercenaria mercenaria]
MWLILQTMGCGRSKQHSPKLDAEEREHINSKEKNNGKKKKSKGENKENKEATSQPKSKSKMSPVKTIVNSLKPPPPNPNLNGSPKLTTLHLDVEYPVYKQKEMDRLAVPPNKEVKEFRGKQNFRVTHSQIAFFEMLDKKIEQGDDYHSDCSIEISTPEDS